MDKYVLKTIGKCIIFGIVWAIVLFVVAILIKNNKGYNFKDVLFVEGIFLVAVGCLSIVAGNPTGLSMRGIGDENPQYSAYTNLEITRMERDKTKNIKFYASYGLSTVSFITGAILVVIISFLI